MQRKHKKMMREREQMRLHGRSFEQKYDDVLLARQEDGKEQTERASLEKRMPPLFGHAQEGVALDTLQHIEAPARAQREVGQPTTSPDTLRAEEERLEKAARNRARRNRGFKLAG